MHPFVYPLTTWAVGAFLWMRPDWALTVSENAVSSIGGTLLSVGSTMLGFLLASLAVLASINHTHLVEMMRKTGHYRDLLLTVFFGCALFVAVSVWGASWLLSSRSPGAVEVAILIGLQFGALVSLLDIGRKFWLVLRNLHPN